MTPARSAGGWGFVTVMVVDIAVRAKLYGSTQCYDRSIADETEDDETGKVSCGKPWQLYCILVGITDFPFPQPTADVSTCMHIRYAYIRLGDAERKLEGLAANIFHQRRARMNKLHVT
jgi:hypothetical protein